MIDFKQHQYKYNQKCSHNCKNKVVFAKNANTHALSGLKEYFVVSERTPTPANLVVVLYDIGKNSFPQNGTFLSELLFF